MRRGGAGGALRTWVLDFCSQYNAYFYHISSITGYVEYGNLSSDGTWDYEIIDIQSAVNTALAQAKESGEFNGEPGKDGEDGTPATHSWNGTTLTITSASGTSSADLKGTKGDKGDTGAQGIQGEKGEKGADGEPGKDGADGKDGKDGYTPVKGTDYFTEADRNEIAEQAAQMVDIPDDVLVVNIIDGMSSHSPAEIRTHIDNGGSVYCLNGAFVYHPRIVSGTRCYFASVEVMPGLATQSEIVIRSDKSVTRNESIVQDIISSELTEMQKTMARRNIGVEEVDLSGYAQKSELPTKVSQLTNDKGYLTEHQDISGKLDTSALPTAIDTALAQAKESGMFDGVSSWNDLKDKPFEEVQHGDTLTWNGNPNSMVVFEDLDEGESFAKIADNIPTLEDMERSVTVEWLGDYTLTYSGDTEGHVINGQEFGYMAIADSDGLDCLLVIQEAGVRGAPETGIYFRYKPEQDSYTQSFHIPDYAFISIKKIDPKYLPNLVGMIAALEERIAALEKQ